MRFKLCLISLSLLFVLALTPYLPQSNYYAYKTGKAPAGTSLQDKASKETSDIFFFPVEHASFNLELDHKSIYVDPTDAKGFKDFNKPEIILITHDHPDHFNIEALEAISTKDTTILGPANVITQLMKKTSLQSKELKILANGENIEIYFDKTPVNIESIAMYNTTDGHLDYHPKGVGNGYVVNYNGSRLYISGDTENTPEMKELNNIDVALICMNQPYTMTIEQAADAVNTFKPKVVIPYHYRNQDKTLSNLQSFKTLVNKPTQVKFLKWYPTESIPTKDNISYTLITFP